MANLPKLRITRAWNPTEEVREMAEARNMLFNMGPDLVILVEGQMVRSYEEMVEMASKLPYRHKDPLNVVITPLYSGRG